MELRELVIREMAFSVKLEKAFRKKRIAVRREYWDAGIDYFSGSIKTDDGRFVNLEIYYNMLSENLVRVNFVMHISLSVENDEIDRIVHFINAHEDFNYQVFCRNQLEQNDYSHFFVGRMYVKYSNLYLNHNIVIDDYYFDPDENLDPYHIDEIINEMVLYINAGREHFDKSLHLC